MNKDSSKHYLKECGCIYTVGELKPWFVCPGHNSGSIRAAVPLSNEPVVSQEGIKQQTYKDRKSYEIINDKIPYLSLVKTTRSNFEIKYQWLYALRLEGNKYYVGITARKNPYGRIMQHGGKFMSAKWTEKHKPLEVLEIRDLGQISKYDAERFEQKMTKAYMKVYGYKNVRGGLLTYSGRLYKFGPVIVNDWHVEQAVTALVLFALGFYILTTQIL